MIDNIVVAVMASLVLGMYLCVGVLASLFLREGCKVKSRAIVGICSLFWPIGMIIGAILLILFGVYDRKKPHD